jgi:LysR family hydrogen peroxide-inducible transcriptional activator
MELRQLEILIAISDHGSFSGAARALSTVQSNVSAHISRLEKELTTSLVDRSSGRLTEDGELVVERARRVLNQVQDIAADVNSKDADVEGETVLGCIGTTARWLMPRLLPELTSKFPKIRVTIVEGSTLNLIPRLTSGSLSAGIVHLPI